MNRILSQPRVSIVWMVCFAAVNTPTTDAASSEWRPVPPERVATVLREIVRRQVSNLNRLGNWESHAILRDRFAMDLGQARDRQGRLLQDSSNRFNTEYTASVEGIVNLQRKQVISRLEIDGNIRFGDSFSQGGENELGSEWTRWTLFDGRDAWTYRPFRTSGVYRYGPSRLDFERPSASDVGPIDEHWFARGFACVDCVFDPRQCFGGPELAIEYLRSTAAAVEGLIASNAFDADLFRFNQRERNGIEYQWIVTDPSWSVPAYLRRRSEWVVAERSGYHFTRCRTIRQLDEEILFECHVDFRNQEGAFLPTAFVVRTYDPENGQYRFSRSVRFVEHQLDVEIDERTFSLGNFDLPRSVETFSSVTPDSLQPPAQRRTPERIPEDASTFVEGQPYEADLSQVWRSLLIVVGGAGILFVGCLLPR